MEHTPHTHARRHTVTVSELRRVLANAPPPRPSLDGAFRSNRGSSSPTSPTTSTSPSSSPPTSATHSPLVTPSAAPGCSDARSLPRTFDVRAASEVCRRIDGYVSFMDVEGLGAPAGIDEDESDEERAARQKSERAASWSSWFGFTPPSTTASSTRPTPSATRAPSKRA